MVGLSKTSRLVSLCKLVFLSPYFWIVIISIFCLRYILFSQGVPHNGDLAYPYNLDLYAERFSSLWNEHTSVTNLENVNRGFTFFFISVAQVLGGIDWAAKLFFLVPLVISGWSMAFLIKYVLHQTNPKQKPSVIVIVGASFIYMVNPWVLEQIQAPYIWLAYAVTPSVILLAYRYFTQNKILLAIPIAVLWSLASGSPPYIIFTGFIIVLIWIMTMALGKLGNTSPVPSFKSEFKMAIVLLSIYAAINAYWIFPVSTVLSSGPIMPGYTFSEGMLDLFSRNSTILNVFGGMDQWVTWYPNTSALWLLALLTKILLPAFLGIALLVKKDDPKLFFMLATISLLATFFSLGGNNPIYRLLATEAPLSSYYGWIFRVPGKISYLLWPAYSVSVAIIGDRVDYRLCQFRDKEGIGEKSSHLLRKNVFLGIVIVAILVLSMGFSIVKGHDFFDYYYAPVEVPAPYREAFDFIGEYLNDSRVADFAPYVEGGGKNSLGFESSYTWNPGRIAGYFSASMPVPSVGFYHFTYSSVWQPAYSYFSDPITRSTSAWLAAYGITHLLYHDDIVGSQDYAAKDLRTLNETGFKLLKRWDYVYLYEVPAYLGRIYTLDYTFPDEFRMGNTIGFDSFDNTSGCFSTVLSNANGSENFHLATDVNDTTNKILLITPKLIRDWTSIRSNVFHPQTDQIFVSAHIRQQNAIQTHIVIRGFDTTIGEWTQIAQVPSGQNGTFTWKTFNGTVKIPATVDSIQLELMGGWADPSTTQSEVAFDTITVKEVLGPPTTSNVEAFGVYINDIRQIDSTHWILRLTSEKPFKLVFTEGYDPSWSAYVENGQNILQSNSKSFLTSINSFSINATGELTIRIEYMPQRWYVYGSFISASAILICIAYLAYSYTKTKPIPQKLKQKLAKPHTKTKLQTKTIIPQHKPNKSAHGFF